MLRNITKMAENVAKKMKTDLSIGTHNGHFHADEALAVYMLRLLPQYEHSTLVRTRDPAKLAECHTVVDVGGEYDASRNLFDHHQRTFTTTFPNRPTKLSSAGLVYMHFGKRIDTLVRALVCQKHAEAKSQKASSTKTANKQISSIVALAFT